MEQKNMEPLHFSQTAERSVQSLTKVTVTIIISCSSETKVLNLNLNNIF